MCVAVLKPVDFCTVPFTMYVNKYVNDEAGIS